MKTSILLIVFAVFAVFSASCASSGSVRDLGVKEKEVIQGVQKRISANKPMVDSASKSLGELGAAYAEKEFELELALAKAKRLESMQSFLASPPEEFRETQRAVVLYHLYEVEQTEQKVLEARMAERRASVEEIGAAYRQLEVLLKDAAKNLEIVLEYLNQPKSARILAFTENFLSEVTAFRETLEKSDNPRLQRLAADVAQFEILAFKAKEDATKALQAYTTVTGN